MHTLNSRTLTCSRLPPLAKCWYARTEVLLLQRAFLAQWHDTRAARNTDPSPLVCAANSVGEEQAVGGTVGDVPEFFDSQRIPGQGMLAHTRHLSLAANIVHDAHTRTHAHTHTRTHAHTHTRTHAHTDPHATG